ncbi:MAG: D-glycerate dehydrogenase [Anaerolineales bacterium]|nr:D-glycerate dehydrogenase [Anaerolineales bacterium]
MNPSELPLVLITHTLPDDWLTSLEGKVNSKIGPTDATYFSPDLEAHLEQAEGLFTLLTIPVSDELLSKAPNLKVISNMAVGVDNIDLDACTRRGIPVGNTPGVLTEATADLTVSLLLASARRLFEANLDARKGLWTTWSPTGWLGYDLDGATLGIIGMGKIGKAVAQRAKGFGMDLIYYDPNRIPDFEISLSVRFSPLDQLLHTSDFVCLHVPLTPQTRHMISYDALRAMKPTATLVNTARGQIVNTEALVTALKEGWIAAAALDVTDPEPLPPNHPLFELPNCLIVPHIGSATRNTRRKMAELACQNLLAGLVGERLPHCANPEVYET